LTTEDRKFVSTVGAAFAVLSAVFLWRGKVVAAIVAGALAVGLALLGLMAPAAVGPVRSAWMAGAHALSRVTTPIILGIVYFLVLTPIALTRRWVGRQSLGPPRTSDTFWVTREPAARPPEDMRRQF
jgi:hypothetical protein